MRIYQIYLERNLIDACWRLNSGSNSSLSCAGSEIRIPIGNVFASVFTIKFAKSRLNFNGFSF
jgi:hypothetical protein